MTEKYLTCNMTKQDCSCKLMRKGETSLPCEHLLIDRRRNGLIERRQLTSSFAIDVKNLKGFLDRRKDNQT